MSATEEVVSLSSRLRQAAIDGCLEQVRSLIKQGALLNYQHTTDARNLPDSNPGKTALHYAAWHGRWEVVDLLLQSGANPNATRMSGDTPLVEWVRGLSNSSPASSTQYHRAAVLLLMAGADPALGADAPAGSAWQAARSKGLEGKLQQAVDESYSFFQASRLGLLTADCLNKSVGSRL